jgi:allophanate hydrolase subunit 1
MELDFFIRARVQVLLERIQDRNIAGVNQLCPCIRSMMVWLNIIVLPSTSFFRFIII